MKKIYTIMFVLMALNGFSQTVTVSTILNSPDANVDDAMALDSQGNLYGSNFSGTTVYKITPSGDVSPFVTGLSNPNGLAFDSNDNLYVVEYSGGAIHKYDINGNLLNTYNVGGFPSGLISAYHSDNVVYTTADFSSNNNGVFELLPDGSSKTLYQGAPLSLPVGLAYGPSGVLYIGDYLTRIVYRITKKGDLEYVATVPAPDNVVPFLAFIAYAQGSLYGTVYGENKIYKINPNAIDDVEIYSGSTFGDMDGDISEATYAWPAGIISNKSGNTLYVSEFIGANGNSGNIRKIRKGKGKGKVAQNVIINTYPNPTTDRLNINLETKTNDSFDVNIYDLSARLVFTTKEVSRDGKFLKTIPLKGLKPGVYHVIITNQNFKRSKKIIIN